MKRVVLYVLVGVGFILNVGVLSAETIYREQMIGVSNVRVTIGYQVGIAGGIATIEVVAESADLGAPEYPTDGRLHVSDGTSSYFIHLGESVDLAEGTDVTIWAQAFKGGWQNIGDPINSALGQDYYRVPYNYTNSTIYDGELNWYRVDGQGVPSDITSHSVAISAGETVLGSWLDSGGPSQFMVTMKYYNVGEEAGLGWVLSDSLETETEIGVVGTVTVPTSSTEPPSPDNETTPTNETDSNAPPDGSSTRTGATTGETALWVNSPSSQSADSLTVASFERGISQLANVVRNSSGSGGGSVTVNVDTDSVVSAVGSNTTSLEAAIQAQTDALLDDSQAPASPQEFDPLTSAETLTLDGDVNNALGMLPDSMSMVAPGTVSTIALSMNLGAAGNYSTTVDLSVYSGPISVFRNVLKAGLAVWFFFLIVKTVREGFAN